MRRAMRVLLPAAALAVGIGSASVEAAPAANALGSLKAAASAGGSVERARWVRRCHWTRWGLRCHRVWVPHRHWRRW